MTQTWKQAPHSCTFIYKGDPTFVCVLFLKAAPMEWEERVGFVFPPPIFKTSTRCFGEFKYSQLSIFPAFFSFFGGGLKMTQRFSCFSSYFFWNWPGISRPLFRCWPSISLFCINISNWGVWGGICQSHFLLFQVVTWHKRGRADTKWGAKSAEYFSAFLT